MIWRAVRQGKVSGLMTRRCAAREGEPSLHFRFASLVSEAARLRHGQDPSISRPGLQLGRAAMQTVPGTHRADTCARALRQVSALFGPRPRLSRHFPPAPIANAIRPRRRIAPAHSDGRKLPGQSGKHRARPKVSVRNNGRWRCHPRRFAPREARTVVTLPVLADRARASGERQAARLRPARKELRREALPIAEGKSISTASFARCKTTAIARDASHGQGISNIRRIDQAFGRFAGYAPETGRPR